MPIKYAQPNLSKVTWLNDPLGSKHVSGKAVDLVPFPVDWNDLSKFRVIAVAMKAAAKELNVQMSWGGDWRTSKDYPHFELAYGSRKAAMREELDAIPRDGSSVCLPTLWVERAMTEVRTILRLTLGDDFNALTPDERDAYIDDWIQRYLEPELQKLDKRKQHCAGQDYARHRDFSFILPFYIEQDLRRVAPFVIEMHRVPSRLQQKILWYMLERLPRFGGIAMDATGNGETIAENTAEKFGEHMVHQIKLSRNWYGLWTPKLVTAFEEDMIDLPRDDNLKNDCSAIEEVDGIHMVSKARAKDLKDPELYRHGDGAVAMILAWFASLHLSSPIEFMALPTHDEIELNPDDFDWVSDVGCF